MYGRSYSGRVTVRGDEARRDHLFDDAALHIS